MKLIVVALLRLDYMFKYLNKLRGYNTVIMSLEGSYRMNTMVDDKTIIFTIGIIILKIKVWCLR